jgi:hypothetical protein
MRRFYNSALALIFLACLLVLPARAANDIQPGLWQDTETGEVNGQKQQPKVTTECIKPEEAKDIVKKARVEMQASFKESGEMAKACSKLDVQEKGNVIYFEMKCGSKEMGGTMEVSMTMTINSPTSTTSVGKTLMSFGGQKLSSNLTTQSKYIGPCRK